MELSSPSSSEDISAFIRAFQAGGFQVAGDLSDQIRAIDDRHQREAEASRMAEEAIGTSASTITIEAARQPEETQKLHQIVAGRPVQSYDVQPLTFYCEVVVLREFERVFRPKTLVRAEVIPDVLHSMARNPAFMGRLHDDRQLVLLFSEYLSDDERRDLRHLNLSRIFKLNGLQLFEILRRAPNLITLDLTYCTGVHSTFLTVSTSSLQELSLKGTHMVDRALENLKLPCLIRLNLSETKIRDSALSLFASTHTQLEGIFLDACRFLTGSSLEVFARHVPRLQELSVVQCRALNPGWLGMIETKVPGLLHLGFGGAPVEPVAIQSIGTSFTRLETLTIHGIPDLDEEAEPTQLAHAKALQGVSSSLIVLNLYKQLRTTASDSCIIPGTDLLEAVSLCQKLRWLSLQNVELSSEQLVHLSVELFPRLLYLDLSGMHVADFSEKALILFASSLNSVRVLNLSDTFSLSKNLAFKFLHVLTRHRDLVEVELGEWEGLSAMLEKYPTEFGDWIYDSTTLYRRESKKIDLAALLKDAKTADKRTELPTL